MKLTGFEATCCDFNGIDVDFIYLHLAVLYFSAWLRFRRKFSVWSCWSCQAESSVWAAILLLFISHLICFSRFKVLRNVATHIRRLLIRSLDAVCTWCEICAVQSPMHPARLLSSPAESILTSDYMYNGRSSIEKEKLANWPNCTRPEHIVRPCLHRAHTHTSTSNIIPRVIRVPAIVIVENIWNIVHVTFHIN